MSCQKEGSAVFEDAQSLIHRGHCPAQIENQEDSAREDTEPEGDLVVYEEQYKKKEHDHAAAEGG